MQDQIAAQEDAIYKIEDNKKTYEVEIDTLRTHLNEHKNAIDQYKKDKQTLYQGVYLYFFKMQENCSRTNGLTFQAPHV